MLESEEKSTRNELEMYRYTVAYRSYIMTGLFSVKLTPIFLFRFCSRSYTLLEEQDGAGITQAPTNTSTRFTLIIYGKIGNVSMYLL